MIAAQATHYVVIFTNSLFWQVLLRQLDGWRVITPDNESSWFLLILVAQFFSASAGFGNLWVYIRPRYLRNRRKAMGRSDALGAAMSFSQQLRTGGKAWVSAVVDKMMMRAEGGAAAAVNISAERMNNVDVFHDHSESINASCVDNCNGDTDDDEKNGGRDYQYDNNDFHHHHCADSNNADYEQQQRYDDDDVKRKSGVQQQQSNALSYCHKEDGANQEEEMNVEEDHHEYYSSIAAAAAVVAAEFGEEEESSSSSSISSHYDPRRETELGRITKNNYPEFIPARGQEEHEREHKHKHASSYDSEEKLQER